MDKKSHVNTFFTETIGKKYTLAEITPYYPISALLLYLSNGRLWEVKNKRKFQTIVF